MQLPDESKILAFENADRLREWLEINHDRHDELFVKIYKKGSGKASVTWGDVVLETLCWGWIDGVKKSLDEEAYLQRITPRKPRSDWSKKNTEHVERLIKEGRMQASGMKQVHAAKKDGRWENAYAPSSQMKVPLDFVAAVSEKPTIKAFYETLKKTNLYAIAYGLETAKKPETRQRRFDKFMDMLSRGEMPDFGFKKKS
ncbi:YdeI family protein [Glaciecola siphonariae]|uniref:YdeI family protein n=1 Tax=Glaciecola siphonariae TaxID=521012 RepID=A0ABV9LSR7_9ALTE